MSQLFMPNAVPKLTIEYSKLSAGFFRKKGDEIGAVFYKTGGRHGQRVIVFRVQDNKNISMCGERTNIPANADTVEVLNCKDVKEFTGAK